MIIGSRSNVAINAVDWVLQSCAGEPYARFFSIRDERLPLYSLIERLKTEYHVGPVGSQLERLHIRLALKAVRDYVGQLRTVDSAHSPDKLRKLVQQPLWLNATDMAAVYLMYRVDGRVSVKNLRPFVIF